MKNAPPQMLSDLVKDHEHAQTQKEKDTLLNAIPDEDLKFVLEKGPGELALLLSARMHQVITDPESLSPFARAKFYIVSGNELEAEKALLESLRIHQNDGLTHLHLSMLRSIQGKTEEALKHAHKSIEHGEAEGCIMLANIYFALGNMELVNKWCYEFKKRTNTNPELKVSVVIQEGLRQILNQSSTNQNYDIN